MYYDQVAASSLELNPSDTTLFTLDTVWWAPRPRYIDIIKEQARAHVASGRNRVQREDPPHTDSWVTSPACRPEIGMTGRCGAEAQFLETAEWKGACDAHGQLFHLSKCTHEDCN